MKREEDIDLDQLRNIWNLEGSLSPDGYQELLDRLTPKEFERLRSLGSGLEKEDEFVLISLLLGRCVNIQKFGQPKYASRSDSIVPDLIATYKKDFDTTSDDEANQITMFLEVKRCHSRTWRISRKDFDRRLNYARQYRARLFFAIDFTCLGLNSWTLFSTDYVRMSGHKIRVTQVPDSVLDIILGNYTVYFDSFELEKVYTKGVKSSVTHPEFGGLERVNILYENNKHEILVGSKPDPAYLVLYALNSTQKEELRGRTTVVKRSYHNQIIPLYNILLAAIRILNQADSHLVLRNYLKESVPGGKMVVDYHYGHYIIDKYEKMGIAQHFTSMPPSMIGELTGTRSGIDGV